MLDSGIPWVGLIPDHWRVKRAKYLFSLAKRPPRATDGIVTAFRDGQVTLRANRRTDGFTNATKEVGYQGVRKGDLVIHAMDAFAGAIGVSDSDGKCTPVYSCCVPNNEATSEFYALCVRTMSTTGYIESLGKGIRERSTDFRWTTFAEQLLPLPPREEQEAIVAHLDRATTRTDALVDKKTRFIKLLREKRQALITHAVTKGLDAGVPMKDSGVEWLGKVPAHWDVGRGNAILVECRSKNDPLVSEYYLSLMANVGIIPYEEKGDVGNKKPEDLTKCKLVSPGDFVINSMNYAIGSYGVSRYSGVCSPVYVVMRHIEEAADPKFIDLILSNSSYQNYAQSFGTGILDHRRAIGWDEIKAIRIPLPPLAEQSEIAEWAIKQRDRVDMLIAKTEHSIALLREHRTALITAAVTGKIDLRGPA